MSLRVVVNLHYFKFKVYQQNSCSPFVVVFHCYTESASPFCWLKTSYATCSHNRHGLMCLCSLAVALVPGWSTSCLPLWLQALYIVIPVELCYWCWKLKIVIKGLLHHFIDFFIDFFPPNISLRLWSKWSFCRHLREFPPAHVTRCSFDCCTLCADSWAQTAETRFATAARITFQLQQSD